MPEILAERDTQSVSHTPLTPLTRFCRLLPLPHAEEGAGGPDLVPECVQDEVGDTMTLIKDYFPKTLPITFSWDFINFMGVMQ